MTDATTKVLNNVCTVCKQQIRTMAFRGTEFCGDNCKKHAERKKKRSGG